MLRAYENNIRVKDLAVTEILENRGRGFASDKESWAELLSIVDQITDSAKKLKKQIDELWDYVSSGNTDATGVLQDGISKSALSLAVASIQAAAVAEIARDGLEPEEDEQ